MELEEIFGKVFGKGRTLLRVRSPGRVNLIGEHTDYNNGYVFPAAIDLEIGAVASARDDDRVNAYSVDFKDTVSFGLTDERKLGDSWSNYIKGVLIQLRARPDAGGRLVRGADIVFRSGLPVGSGLSSSAAFELANAEIFTAINGIDISPKDKALLCQKAENEFIGVKCGIMDQFAIALGRKGCALFLDTMTLGYETVPLAMGDLKIVIGNTNKPRTLAGSAYNQRRAECESAVKSLKTVLP